MRVWSLKFFNLRIVLDIFTANTKALLELQLESLPRFLMCSVKKL
jgi:hypothetical protein